MSEVFTFVFGFIVAWIVRGALFKRAVDEAFEPLISPSTDIKVGEIYRTESADPFVDSPSRWLITDVRGDYIQYVAAEHPVTGICWSGRAKSFLLVNKKECLG